MELVPKWVEQKLAEENTPSEVQLLRNFYKSWQDLHSINHPHTRQNRPQAEQAAQVLVDASLALNAFYHPIMLNGH